MKLFRIATIALLSANMLFTASADEDNGLSFIAFGDLPYNDKEVDMLRSPKGSLTKVMQQMSPPFIIHYGDIKPGDMDCSDQILLERRELLANVYPKRLVYTPGDNEWTDCDREYVPVQRDELERLEKLRTLYFEGAGLAMAADIKGLQRQSESPENVMWREKNILFGTIHLPGTNNGRDTILQSDVKKALDLADWRDEQNRKWLTQLYQNAENTAAKALVIAFQADIFRPSVDGKTQPCDDKERVKCNGFIKTREFLEFASANIDIPVLLIHGDTSSFCLHQPNEKLAPNLWRLNGPGDYTVIDGVSINVDPNNKILPFAVKTLLSKETPPAICKYKK